MSDPDSFADLRTVQAERSERRRAEAAQSEEAPTEDATPEGDIEAEASPEVEAPQEEALEEPESPDPVVEGDDAAERPDPDPTYTVTVNGEDQELTLDELRNGYLGSQALGQKFREVAEVRKGLEAQHEAFAAKVEEAELLAQVEAPDPDELQRLKTDDPDAYIAALEKAQARQDKLAGLKAERDRIADEKRATRVKEEQDLLLAAVPEWNPEIPGFDQDAMAAEMQAMDEVTQAVGYSPEELAGDMFLDHRAMAILRLAAKYAQLQNAQPEKKVEKRPPTSQTPGSTARARKSSQELEIERLEKAAESGKMGDINALRRARRAARG
mgnify:CR=1 FL=1